MMINFLILLFSCAVALALALFFGWDTGTVKGAAVFLATISITYLPLVFVRYLLFEDY